MEKSKVKANISIENLQIDYDKGADVLYISFGDPKEANDSIEVQDGVVCKIGRASCRERVYVLV